MDVKKKCFDAGKGNLNGVFIIVMIVYLVFGGSEGSRYW